MDDGDKSGLLELRLRLLLEFDVDNTLESRPLSLPGVSSSLKKNNYVVISMKYCINTVTSENDRRNKV